MTCSLVQVWPCQSTLSDLGTISGEDGQGLLLEQGQNHTGWGGSQVWLMGCVKCPFWDHGKACHIY